MANHPINRSAVVATAGHVDHGKSTLVRALTGTDPDRLSEEKRRGLTIDIGFAEFVTPSGIQVGFVDLPGHQRFIRNMLAGVGSTPAALLIVAADEGPRQQTREHLAILDLLSVSTGMVVVTRTDLAEPEETVGRIVDLTRGTVAQRWPVKLVDSVSGRGLSELVTTLDEILGALPDNDLGRPHLWVDRSFKVDGAGTVVTGTLRGGNLRPQSRLVSAATGDDVRIRGIQAYSEFTEMVAPPSRVALNLSGPGAEGLGRGDLLSVAGTYRLTDTFAATFRPVADALPKRLSATLHLGTLDVACSLRVVADNHPRVMVVRCEREIGVTALDRFIIRDTGRGETVAGGQVLDVDGHAEIDWIRSRIGRTPHELLEADVERFPFLDLGAASARTSIPRESIVHADHQLLLDGQLITRSRFGSLTREAVRLVTEFHSGEPLKPGMDRNRLQAELAIGSTQMQAALGEWTRDGTFEVIGNAVALTGRAPGLSDEDQRIANAASEALDAMGFMPEPIALPDTLRRELVRRGDLVQVSAQIIYTRARWTELCRTVLDLIDTTPGGVSVSDVRKALDVSRKFAVPILESMDRLRYTQRVGDLRVAGSKAGDAR